MPWRAALRTWHAAHVQPGSHFGSQRWWREAYAEGRAAPEWFLSAGAAAQATADALSQRQTPLNVLHLGCGASTLGVSLCSALDCAAVLNVDCSPEAVAACEANQRAHAAAPQQRYALWDATDARFPPGSFDLLVDKGTLDAVAFAGGAPLEGYFSAVREALWGTDALWVQLSEEPPEGPRSALLQAAFPEAHWRVESTAVDEADSSDAVVAGEDARSEWEFLYFRYAVRWRA